MAALGVGTLLVVGAGVVATDLAGAPEASADASLQPFSDCEELIGWYRDASLPHVTAYGLGGDGAVAFPMAAAAEDSAAGAAPAAGAARDGAAAAGGPVGASETGTNVQEAGVDEPSRIKVADDVAWTLAGSRLVAVDVADGQVLGEVDLAPPTPGSAGTDGTEGMDPVLLPADRSFTELLLLEDRVVVLGSSWLPAPQDEGSTTSGSARGLTVPGWGPVWGNATTTATTVDVSEASTPSVLDRVEVEGTYVSARAGGGDVRLVTTVTPQLPFVDPWRVQQERLTADGADGALVEPDGALSEPDAQDEAEALARNQQAVRDASASDWLPDLVQRDDAGGVVAQTPVDCASVAHPGTQAGAGTVTVATLDPTAEQTLTGTTSVSSDGSLVYASTDRLYVATTRGGWLWGGAQEQTRTDLHGFATGEPGRTDYLGSGSVEGWLLGSWAMDAHEGHLRVGTTSSSPVPPSGDGSADGLPGRPAPVGATSSSVVVLREGADALTEVGRVDGLGPGEQIRSLRWFDDLAVVVTFEQTDPLYTVDLAEETAPQVLGELKVLGYSGYLHPLGDGMLLGVGQDGTEDGALLGAKVETYDVTDLAAPTDLATLTWPGSSSAVEWDSRLFAYLPGSRTAVLPLDRYDADSWSTGLVAVRVAEDGSVTETGAWDATEGGGVSGLATTADLVLVAAQTYGTDGSPGTELTVLSTDGLRPLAQARLG
ncbi:beta-propeller domain-containing protein [Aquipuribacter sp. MA13-13]|uniref:beta-propeller domain-containing protein n=1 Tax=Aquipuribacter sp. MA13-13 TaxID=3440840 RepID=UPI003EF002AC